MEKETKLKGKIETLKAQRAEHIGRRKTISVGSAAWFAFSRSIDSFDARIDRAEFNLKYGNK